jgi:hypothetical protein
MAYAHRKPKDNELERLLKTLTDRELQQGLRLLQREQDSRGRHTLKPIQPCGDIVHRHG